MITHTKEFGVYHWDTFDNVTLLIDEFHTENEADTFIHTRYFTRLSSHGADQVDIVDKSGNVVKSYNVS